MRYFCHILLLLVLGIAPEVFAANHRQTPGEFPPAVALRLPTATPETATIDTTGLSAIPRMKPKQGLIAKIINYFDDSNKPKKNKKFDFSVIGGPYYSSDTKFGIGLVAAGLYRTSRRDSLMAPSDVALYLKATTSMYFELGVRGTHILPSDRMRICYDVNFASVATHCLDRL